MLKEYSPLMNESAVTGLLDAAIERAGGLVTAFIGQAWGSAGRPDRRYESKVWRGWVEYKREDNELSGLQRLFIEGCIKRNSPILVVRTFKNTGALTIEDAKQPAPTRYHFDSNFMKRFKWSEDAQLQLAGRTLLQCYYTAWSLICLNNH